MIRQRFSHRFSFFCLNTVINGISKNVLTVFGLIISEKQEFVLSSTIPLSECTCYIHNGHEYCRKCTVW